MSGHSAEGSKINSVAGFENIVNKLLIVRKSIDRKPARLSIHSALRISSNNWFCFENGWLRDLKAAAAAAAQDPADKTLDQIAFDIVYTTKNQPLVNKPGAVLFYSLGD